MNYLLDAIKTAFDADATLSASVNGIFWEEVDEFDASGNEIKMPYITVHLLNNTPTYEGTFSGYIEATRVQFSIWSDNKQGKEVNTISGYLTQCFDYAVLTYTDGYDSRYVIRKAGPDISKEFGVWRSDIEYEIQTRGVT